MVKSSSTKILVLLTLFSSTLFSIITPMAEELTSALYLTDQDQVAFINSMFLIVGASFSLVWAILGDKFPRKFLLIIATFEWSFLTLLTIFSTNFQTLLIFQLFTAIGFGAALPLVFSLMIDIVEPDKRGRKFGVLSAVYVLGNGLGQILSGFLIEIYTWQIPLIIISIAGFISGSLLFLIQEPVKGGKDDLYRIDTLNYKIKKEDLKQIWKIRSTVLILILNFTMFIAIGAMSSFYITMLRNDFSLFPSLATIFLIIVYGSQVPSGPMFGKLGDKKRKFDPNGRIKVALICLLFGSILYIIAYSMTFISKNIFTAYIILGITFFGAFLFGGIDPLTQATLGEINPPQVRSTIYSLNYLAYSFGRSISLLILGQLFLAFNSQYTPGYFILSIMALACCLILVSILKFLPRDIEKIKSKEL
ncbi:MAG: MFS transporter [Candidatus Hodarchaeota archaeon]